MWLVVNASPVPAIGSTGGGGFAPAGAAASTPAVEVISPAVPDRYAEAAADDVTWVIATFASSPSVPLAPPVFAYSGRRLGRSARSPGGPRRPDRSPARPWTGRSPAP